MSIICQVIRDEDVPVHGMTVVLHCADAAVRPFEASTDIEGNVFQWHPAGSTPVNGTGVVEPINDTRWRMIFATHPYMGAETTFREIPVEFYVSSREHYRIILLLSDDSYGVIQERKPIEAPEAFVDGLLSLSPRHGEDALDAHVTKQDDDSEPWKKEPSPYSLYEEVCTQGSHRAQRRHKAVATEAPRRSQRIKIMAEKEGQA
ncbi:hypothetical protein PG993_008079 [Apiospora rasikravindrae]|uniref:Transthyretin/hydroxyisourate hydrolase domain-containing protein n=1 Tax=Apiospora rasikravindrae TaxID=990691 RepID=A0ABR1SZB5_9PEZI